MQEDKMNNLSKQLDVLSGSYTCDIKFLFTKVDHFCTLCLCMEHISSRSIVYCSKMMSLLPELISERRILKSISNTVLSACLLCASLLLPVHL